MTAKQAQTIEQALARAAKEGIRIVGYGTMKADGSRFWLVSSRDYATTNRAYVVKLVNGMLECNCRAQGICKHRAVVHHALKEERAALASIEQEHPKPEGIVEVCIKYQQSPIAEVEARISEANERQALAMRQEVVERAGRVIDRALEASEAEQEEIEASRIADMERSLAWDREPEAQEPEQGLPWEVQRRRDLDGYEAEQPEAHEYGQHAPLPDGWEINEEGAGWVARFNGRAILTPRGRNIKRFSSWFAAQHGIDNELREQAKEAERQQRRETALLQNDVPDFDAWMR